MFETFSFEQLGLPAGVCEWICGLQKGLVLCTGATGSGKSTTLASLLNVINIELPALRSRQNDIPLLAQKFLEEVREDANRPSVQGYSEEALAALQRHHWPGNVRELQNVVERAVLLGKSDTIELTPLPVEMRFAGVAPGAAVGYTGQTLKEALAGPERQIILEVLELNGWNRNETADQLGINRTTLYKKMKRLGLEDRPMVREH